MQLTYWVSVSSDEPCYNIRRRTYKDCLASATLFRKSGWGYDQPNKITVEYTDAFDLINQTLSTWKFDS